MCRFTVINSDTGFRAIRYSRGEHGVVKITGLFHSIKPGIGLISVHSTELTIFLNNQPFWSSFPNYSLNSLNLGLTDLIIHGYVLFVLSISCMFCIFQLQSLKHNMLHVS